MLYLFDLDNTLISGYMQNPDKAYHTWHVLPGRREKLAQLRERGNDIAIVTNQNGVALELVSKDDVVQKFHAVQDSLNLPNRRILYDPGDMERGCRPQQSLFYVEWANSARKKPSPTMLLEAMTDYDHSRETTLYVGDRPEDEQAAQRAGVRFQWAHIFFKD